MLKTSEERRPSPWPRRWAGRVAAAALLVGLQWVGEALVAALNWPLPGSLPGLLMLLGLLAWHGGVPQGLDDVAAPLLQHLMLFLIPSIAAVVLYGHLLQAHGAVFVLVATLGTAFTIVVTGGTLHVLMKRRPP